MHGKDVEVRPNHFPWPPILYASAVVASFALDALWPSGFGMPWPWRSVGIGILGLGLGLDLSAIFILLRHRTTFRPDRGTTSLVTSGPYAVSRNPIYLGNTIALAGLAVAIDNAWILATLPFVTIAVQKLAIEREEQHLAAVFDGNWEAYRRQVRRWI